MPDKQLMAGRRPFREFDIRSYLSRRTILLIALILAIIVIGLIFPYVPSKYQLTMILFFPGVVGTVLILRNPILGVYCYYMYEYIRPDGSFPSLQPLKISLIIQMITLVSWVVCYLKANQSLKWDKFNWFYLGFVLVMAFSTVTAENNYFAFQALKTMTSYFLIFIISTHIMESIKDLTRLVWILVLIHFYYAVKGIITGGFVRTSLMGDENDLALAMNVMIPFAFFTFTYAPNKLKKFLFLVIMIALVLAVIASMSRGGWVGLIATVIFCILRTKRKGIGLAAMTIIAVAVIAFAPPKYWAEVRTISDTHEATAESRLEYWKSAVYMFLDNPILGVGGHNGPQRMPEYYVGRRDRATTWGRTFHGTLPQVLAELGTTGMICYLIMFFLVFRYLRKLLRRDSSVNDPDVIIIANSILGGLIGYIATATFLSTAYYPQLWTLYNIALVLVFYCRKTCADKNATAEGLGSTDDKNASRLLHGTQ
jgi:probable O-glycosylation ligase (exosortase A-associated)